MRVNTGLFRASNLTKLVVIGLLLAFVCYANGASWLTHHALAHSQDATAGHADCSGHHQHTDPKRPTPAPKSDDPCQLCDIFLTAGTLALTTPNTSPAPHTEAVADRWINGSLTCDPQPQTSISRRGPPSHA